MSELDSVSAGLLRHSARALAGFAASTLFESRLELKNLNEPDAFRRWHNLLTQCVEELAASFEANRPRWFLEHVEWMQSLLAARGVPPELVQAALSGLQSVLADRLPPGTAETASFACEEAIRELTRNPTPSTPRPTDGSTDRLAKQYLLSLLEGDRTTATRLVTAAVDDGASVATVCREVLFPSLREVGQMWHDGETNIAEEHFVTATTKAILSRLRDYLPGTEPRGKTLLAASVAGNRHDIGIHAIGEFFESDGWRVIVLGADVPIVDLVEAVAFYEVDLLALSASLRTQIAELKHTIEAVRQSERGSKVKILVGGYAFEGDPNLAVELGADGYAVGPEDAVAVGNSLMS